MIDTRVVYGFKGAGKTSYISDCVLNDFFYKDGKTLILCLEQGRENYDTEALRKRNAFVSYYDGAQEIGSFCAGQIREHQPDRIYVEMNTKYPSARESFPDEMKVTSAVTWIDWETLDRYFDIHRQRFGQMVAESQQITFRGCPSKELLAPYSQAFRLMNHKASYLRQDPMGFHEKAFDLFVPYSLDAETITITENEYLIFWLDAADHPEHYEGKTLCFTDPLELRFSDEKRPKSSNDQAAADSNSWSAGRIVMTCCMADLQFMSFKLIEVKTLHAGWVTIEAIGRVGTDEYGQKKLKLDPVHFEYASAPEGGIILQVGNRRKNTVSNMSRLGYRGMK